MNSTHVPMGLRRRAEQYLADTGHVNTVYGNSVYRFLPEARGRTADPDLALGLSVLMGTSLTLRIVRASAPESYDPRILENELKELFNESLSRVADYLASGRQSRYFTRFSRKPQKSRRTADNFRKELEKIYREEQH